MYQCSKCYHTMSYPHDRCPSCGVLLSGVKCQGCHYVGGKQEFISNNHRCPKCGSIVQIPGVTAAGGGSGACFIATAVYGDYDCPEVQVLRRFRDTRLAHWYMGRWFIQFYYRHGKNWARTVKKYPWIGKGVRRLLDKIVFQLSHD